MSVTVIERDFFDSRVILETGKMAKQADGAVMIRQGDTMVLATAVVSPKPREGTDFLPLTCDYQERTSSAGKIPGGFFKREGRPGEKEVLTSRLIDRPLRPRFPKGFVNEIQIIATILSKDEVYDGDVLAICASSAALHISKIPFDGPIAAVRVAYCDGKFIANPTHQQTDQSTLDIVVAASRDAIIMVEGETKFVAEDLLIQALMFGQQACLPLIEMQEELRRRVGEPKMEFVAVSLPEDVIAAIRPLAQADLPGAITVKEKHPRREAIEAVKETVFAKLNEGRAEEELITRGVFDKCFEEVLKETLQHLVLVDKIRIDGRRFDEVRPISIEAGLLPRTHGSALFTRGETQALVTATLGTSSDEQKIDSLTGETWRRFMLHYNFPPFSVGEVKFLRSPGRREIGHGNLARRALNPILPTEEQFPYTIRIVSDVLESNGSSSMATVCGGSLCLMDAGIPVSAPVAGVAMGLLKGDGMNFVVLTDILGDEDHLGDMDFKVAGTAEGVTAIQMDIKVNGITEAIFRQALAQAHDARLHILGKMNEVLGRPRPDLSPYAPRIVTLQISVDKIRDLIGPGGKTIRAIIEETGVKIDVEDDGRVLVASADGDASALAIRRIREITAEPEEGKYYLGKVVRIESFGAFVQILPGTDGLIHISQLANERVNEVEDVINIGDEVLVKVIEIDKERGRVRLSRKAALGLDPKDVIEQ
ncbi:MAG: polyribonucleotide nucleotidyltransferase [Myxococcales bacterium]|nr:polyribonucleotide nucleotidyltransferase [Myxococcales bacterium]